MSETNGQKLRKTRVIKLDHEDKDEGQYDPDNEDDHEDIDDNDNGQERKTGTAQADENLTDLQG